MQIEFTLRNSFVAWEGFFWFVWCFVLFFSPTFYYLYSDLSSFMTWILSGDYRLSPGFAFFKRKCRLNSWLSHNLAHLHGLSLFSRRLGSTPSVCVRRVLVGIAPLLFYSGINCPSVQIFILLVCCQLPFPFPFGYSQIFIPLLLPISKINSFRLLLLLMLYPDWHPFYLQSFPLSCRAGEQT